jgi:hypothetical protein
MFFRKSFVRNGRDSNRKTAPDATHFAVAVLGRLAERI